MRVGVPAKSPSSTEEEFSYQLLLVLYDEAIPEYVHAKFNSFLGEPGLETLLKRVNALLSTAGTTTYRR
jgi:hypothetical protein